MKSHLFSLCLSASAFLFGAETQPPYLDNSQSVETRTEDSGGQTGSFDTVRHQVVARRAAWEGMVSLANEKRALPLNAANPAFPLKVSSNQRYLVNKNDVPFTGLETYVAIQSIGSCSGR